MSKINDENLKKIPIIFSKLKEYESDKTDSRFTEVLIKILHTGRNYNGSVFKKSVVENAIPTLANTPILGFIEPDKEGSDDFSDHRVVLVNDDGKQKLRYMGHAYGVISESQAQNAYFQEDLCSDGIMREFLYVKGLLFNKFDYVIDMFKNADGTYNQSMELADEYVGHFDSDEGGFVFDEFAFNGACIITCCPAMIDSEITTNFSKENNKSIANEIENKLNEFAKYFDKKKEDDEMAKKEVEKTIKEKQDNEKLKNSKVEEDTSKKEKDNEVKNEFVDDKTDDTKEDIVSEEESDGTDTEENKDKEDMACGNKKKYTLCFELSHEDVSSLLWGKLCDLNNIEDTYYCLVKTYDAYFIYIDCMTGQYFEQPYVQSNDEITFTEERKEIFNIFIDKETLDSMTAVTYSMLQKELEDTKSKIQEYSKANEELLKFQVDVKEKERKAEIDGVISRFSNINELDLENYKQKAYNKEITKDDLEKNLYAELGKMNFSKITVEKPDDKPEVPTNYTVSLKGQNQFPYEGCEELFK